MKKINVVLTSSDYYACYTSVTMYSVLSNLSEDYRIKFYLISYDITEKSKRILETLKKYKDFDIEYIIISEDSGLPKPKQARVNNIAYARLKVASYLKDEDRCIVMDSDLIFDYDISKLWNTDLEGKCLGLAKDPLLRHDGITKWWEHFNVPEEYTYTNTGVILIDLEKWRELNIEQKIFDNFSAYENMLLFYDQDLIYMTCYDTTKYLDDKWNYLPNIYYSNPELKQSLINTSYVYHFGGPPKPWINPNVELADYWWKYARKSPYYEIILTNMINEQRNELLNEALKNSEEKTVAIMDNNINVKLNTCASDILNTMHTSRQEIMSDMSLALNYRKNILTYWRYKILSNITFGKKKEHYKNKRLIWKTKIKTGKILRGI